MTEITIEISDMKCEGCVNAVRDALSGLSGVHNVRVSLEDKTATLDIDDSVTLGHLTHVVETAGYKAILKT